MTLPSPPDGYDTAYHVDPGRRDCLLTVGFDRDRRVITRFIIQLHYRDPDGPLEWERIARMDHNETSTLGHDVYKEGLHVDVYRRSSNPVHLALSHTKLPPNCGAVIRGCVEYVGREAQYFIDVFEERRAPGQPPEWPDGGDRAHRLFTPNPLDGDMSSGESEREDILTVEELTEVLAEATDTTPAAIEEEAAALEIDSPEDAEVVGYEGRDPTAEPDG